MTAYQTIHDLTALGSAPAPDDEVEVWDESDGATRRASVAQVAAGVVAAGGIATDAEVGCRRGR